jgi:hypothetical protein
MKKNYDTINRTTSHLCIKQFVMIKFIKQASIISWIAFIVHLFLFSTIAYYGFQKSGYHWSLWLISIVPPCIFFYQNVNEDKIKRKI